MILAILFMVMFSSDVFEMEASWKEKLLGFLIHSIPALILTLVLAVAWKMEMTGGILIIIATIIMLLKFNAFTTNKGALILFVPFLLAGFLFILGQVLYHQEKNLQKEGEKAGS
jgi:predicted membrane channel-forming protein YqfA (hemolysin III family)